MNYLEPCKGKDLPACHKCRRLVWNRMDIDPLEVNVYMNPRVRGADYVPFNKERKK